MNDPALLPADAPRLHARGDELLRAGRLDEAAETYRTALRLRPTQVASLNNLAVALQGLGQIDTAIDVLRQARSLEPSATVATNLGNLLKCTGRLDEALVYYAQSLLLRPADADTLSNMAATLRDAGRVTEAIACYRAAVDANPNHVVAHSGLLYTLHFDPAQTRQTLAAEHRQWNDRHAAALTATAPPHGNRTDRDRRLRVGYVSPNFTRHPVGRFIAPLLAAHDHRAFEIFCYGDVDRHDALTHRLKSDADVWRDTRHLSDSQLAAVVRGDGIDVLVDLNLHMAHSRLLAFARRPAPVQITYLAYAGASGLTAMDYRISDAALDPDPQDPAAYSETTLRLPRCYWCYAPGVLPAVSPLPALHSGQITFGCLNNFCKVSPAAVATWAALLRKLPTSRLKLHAHAGKHRQDCEQRFAAVGVDAGRIEWLGFLPHDAYFAAYQAIDIALDPFPYAGGTTTCDALWMGVPVVSLAGATAVGRGGLSILWAAGLEKLVAATPEDYVGIAAGLAEDLPALAALRATLRAHVEASPLADAGHFTRDMESLYRTAWTRWCDAASHDHSTI